MYRRVEATLACLHLLPRSASALAVLMLGACALAVPATVEEPAGFWSGPAHAPVPASVRGGRVIETAALAALLQQPGAVLIDASDQPRRPPELAPGSLWLPPPHAVIPGSLWLPQAGRAALSAQEEEALRQRLVQLTQGDVARPVVAYCHERCWLSWNAAHRLVSLGYRNVLWYPAGIEGWRGAGQPTALVDAPP